MAQNITNDPAFKKKLEQMTPQMPRLNPETVEFPTLDAIAQQTAREVGIAPQPAFDTLAAQPLDIAAAAPAPVQAASAPMEGASQFNVPSLETPSVFTDQAPLGQMPSANIGQLPETPSPFSTEGAAQVNPMMASQLGQTAAGTIGVEPQSPAVPQGGGTITKGDVTTTFAPQVPQVGGGAITTSSGETFTTQGFGQQVSDVTGQAPAAQGTPADVQAMQQREAQIAQRVAGLTPEERAREIAMNDAAVNKAQIRGEEAQGLFRPSEAQIQQAQTEAVARQADYEQRQVNNRIDSQMRQWERDNPRATEEATAMQRQQLIEQEKLVETPEQRKVDPFERSITERKQSLAERKYNDAVAKEAAGVPLSPSDQLARDKWEYEKSKEPAKTATDRNIERLMKANPDLSYSEAVNIEHGVVSKTVNPLTGATETTNIVSGESTPVTSTAPLQDASLDLEPLEPGSSLFERGQKYTGAIESGLRGAQRVAGQFGGKVASDESVQTKKELDAFQGSLVRAFQEGDRFSTGQDKVLREELDATLGAWKDPETFKNNAIALDKVMRQRHADLMENYKNLSYKDDFRSDSLSKARVLENAIRDLGVTQEDGEGGVATGADAPPEGINPEAAALWKYMSPEGRAVFQPKAK